VTPTALDFFDCNARIGRPTVYREGQITTTDELLAEMDYAGIRRALVYHTLAAEWSPNDGNDMLRQELAGQNRLYPCFVALPPATGEMPDPDGFARMVREAHGAVRLFPQDHTFSLLDWCAGPLLEALAAHSVPVLVHIGQTSWGELSAVLSAHPDLPLILLGTYYRVDRCLYPLWERHDNLFVESTTYQTFRGIESVCARFGASRLVFGTNVPELETGGAMTPILYADIPQEDRAAIASGNLMRLLGIEH